MDKKAHLLKFACVLISLEVVFLVASLVTGAMAAPVDGPPGNAGLSLWDRALIG